MRRTYEDLAQAAEIKGLVTWAISGHATEQMREHYGTVAQTETRQGSPFRWRAFGRRRRQVVWKWYVSTPKRKRPAGL
jgi:hypothetical protein